MGVDEANSASSEASKGSVHGTLPQHLAVDAVIGGGGNGSDHVCGVNVLDVDALQSQAEHYCLASSSMHLKPETCKE